MLLVPMKSQDSRSDALIMVIGPKEMGHMSAFRPSTIDLQENCGPQGLTLVNPRILLAYDEDPDTLYTRFLGQAEPGSFKNLIHYLYRGLGLETEEKEESRETVMADLTEQLKEVFKKRNQFPTGKETGTSD